jgi:hypothetical protein
MFTRCCTPNPVRGRAPKHGSATSGKAVAKAASECAPVEGATSPEYDLTEGDLSSTLRVRVGVHSAVDSISDVSPVTPVIGAAGALAGERPPIIFGGAQVGQALTAKQGAWSGGVGALTYTYQWESCNQYGTGCSDIEGATESSYVPVAGDAGRRLRVLLTAADEQDHRASRVSQATQPVAAAQAPVGEQAPPVAGPALVGQTLSAQTGVFSGEALISYTYQWEHCGAGGGTCQAIDGATQSSYTLTEADSGDTILVLVSASDENGSTTAVSAPTATVGPEALTELSAPSVSGTVQLEGTLSADPAIWAATGAVSYAYQWQSCNLSGADCTPIEGASEPTYTVDAGDLGSTLRVQVTVTSPLGSKSAVSAATLAPPGGEVSTEEAQEILQRTDPAVLAASTSATLEGQSIAPALGEAEEELAAQSTLTSSTISKETAGEFAVNTPAGELSLAPVESSPHATTLPTIVNGAAALFANTWLATDTIVRPAPLGTSMILQIRSTEAPHTYSWEARLGPDQELQQLPDGAVAIIETPEGKPTPTSPQEQSKPIHLKDTTGAGHPETSEEKTEAEHAEAEAEKNEEAPLEKLPQAPRSETPAGEAGHGQPQPQNTQSAYETANTAMSYAEAHASNTLAVIAPPNVTDAEGNTIPASLSVTGSTLTMTIKPPTDATYPLLADTTIAAPTNTQSTERDPVKYGLSDPLPEENDHIEEGHIDEHFEENGNAAPGFDPNLFDGPPHTPRHIRTFRLIVPYDVLFKLRGETSKETAELEGYRAVEKQHLEKWLEKLKGIEEATKPMKEEIEPYITIGQDFVTDPCERHSKSPAQQKCTQPSAGNYEEGVARLIEEVIRWHSSNGWPLVKLWGAWNEPDAFRDPFHMDPQKAAQFWEIANETLNKIIPHFPCSGCSIVAGEFAEYSPYHSCYRNVIFYGYCHKTNNTYYYKRYWLGKPRDPVAWGFHDYEDLLSGNKHTAQEFAGFAHERLAKPRLFMSEAGVELQDGGQETNLGELEAKTETAKAKKRELQQKAAEIYLHLSEELSYPIDRMYYYEYTAPTLAQQEEHAFDSALLEVEGGHRRERPAYCVLAYAQHMCSPTAEAESMAVGVGNQVCSTVPSSVKVTGHIHPNGAKVVSYYFEYGSTTTYGQPTAVHSMKTKERWTPIEVHAEIPVTMFEETVHGKCPSTIHFRLVGENAQASGHGTDQTITFVVAGR